MIAANTHYFGDTWHEVGYFWPHLATVTLPSAGHGAAAPMKRTDCT